MTSKRLAAEILEEKVAIIMGTRPGIVKMAPIVKELNLRNIPNFIIHTGQHYSKNMDLAFFESLELPAPLKRVDSTRNYSTHAEQTAEMMGGVEQILLQERPKIVLVCGDANTNLAAGLASRKLGIITGHVESGLRSHDWTMPEEHNRVILDHISELLFAPTVETCNNLVADNVRGRIYLTGNTIVDSTLTNYELAEQTINWSKQFGVQANDYILLTTHREENVDTKERLVNILQGAKKVSSTTGRQILYPAHPRARKRLREFGLINDLLESSEVILLEPTGYLEFLMLIKNAALILTDSGGVQEESCILRTPCVTLRDNTERPETITVGSNVLAGTAPDDILRKSLEMIEKKSEWSIPFGDGFAAIRIIDTVERALAQGVELIDISTVTRLQHNERFEQTIRNNE